MNTDLTIRLERKEDFHSTEELVREAFWNQYRQGCLEHYVLHTFRESPDFLQELDFVMEKNGVLIGQVMFVRNHLKASNGECHPVMHLGPICIHPSWQHHGYGKMLLDFALEKAAGTDAVGVFLEGNRNFYGKSGFVVASTLGIRYMDEAETDEVPYFLCRVLKPECRNLFGARYHVPQGYFVDETKAAEFDREFPYKEAMRLPGQLF